MKNKDVDILQHKGYIWPNPEGIDRAMKEYHQPQGYTKFRKDNAQICQTIAEMKNFVGEWMLTNKRKPWAKLAR